MCDPATIALMIGSVGSLFGALKEPPKPPAVEPGAVAAPTNRTPGAIVRLGNGEKDIKNTTDNKLSTASGFVEQRKSGQAIGGLGRSGLAL